MKKAGYRLVFESEEAAAAARDQCDHTSRKTGWQEKAECGRNVVFVPNNTLLGEEDFHEEDCTQEEYAGAHAALDSQLVQTYGWFL